VIQAVVTFALAVGAIVLGRMADTPIATIWWANGYLTYWTCHSFVPVPCSVFMQLFVQKPVGFSNLMLSGDELDCKTH
jgi:hypothetical protein